MKSLVVACLIALLLGAVVSPLAGADPLPPEPAPEPTASAPSSSPSPGVNLVFNWDFGVIATAVKRALSETFGSIVDGIQKSVFEPISASSLNFLTQTPPAVTYAHPTVTSLWEYSRAVASAAFVVVLLVGAYGVMASQATSAPFADALLTIRSAAFGLLLANTSLWWIGLSVDLGNALTSGVGSAGLPTASRLTFSTMPLEQTLLALVYVVMGILLLLQMLVRLALLDVLVVTAPIAVLLGALPQFQHWSRLWKDLFVATLFSQFVQILALRLGTALTAQLGTSLADSVTGFLAGIAVLYLTLKLPGILSAGIYRAGGSASLVSTLLALKGAQRLLAARGVAAASTAGTAAASRSARASGS